MGLPRPSPQYNLTAPDDLNPPICPRPSANSGGSTSALEAPTSAVSSWILSHEFTAQMASLFPLGNATVGVSGRFNLLTDESLQHVDATSADPNLMLLVSLPYVSASLMTASLT